MAAKKDPAKKAKKAVWEGENPKSSSKKMSKGEKADATKRAKAGGRSKPSLVDNINAQKSSKKQPKKKKKKASGGKKSGSKEAKRS